MSFANLPPELRHYTGELGPALATPVLAAWDHDDSYRDHELSHAGREEDAKGEKKYVLQSHDVEEFGGIVKRWGLWKKDLIVFAGAVVPAHQLGMFEGSAD